ncbi:MAG: zonular occludens toxin domain-containing protein [Verrucomicrobiota bacterium]
MIGFLKLVTGNMGGGKTSYVVELGIEHLLKGGTFATNIKMHLDKVAAHIEMCGYEFDPSRLIHLTGDVATFFDQVPRGDSSRVVLVAVDEAALEGMNSRDWGKLDRRIFNFCTLARKLDIGTIYITQQPEFFDRQLRKLCNGGLVDCRNLREYRLWGVIPIPLPLLVRVHHSLTGGVFRKTFSEPITVRKWVWPLYDSDALLGAAAGEFSQMQRAASGGLRRIKPKTDNLLPFAAVAASVLCAAFFSSF